MKNSKRLLSISLLLCLLMGIFSVSAGAADTEKDYKDYEYYMCVGDSIAAGCALPKDGNEDYFNYDGKDRIEYLTALYAFDSELIYRGYDTNPVPTAYHSIVAEALETNLLQCARSGLRAVEFRYYLDGVYNDSDETYSWGNTYFDMDGDGFAMDDLEDVNQIFHYKENVKKANLITLNLGSNDVLSPSFSAAVLELTADSDDPTLAAIREKFLATGDAATALIKLLDAYQSVNKLNDALAVLVEAFNKNFTQFKTNYTAILEAIYKENPDVDIVGVSVYNPFQNLQLSEDSKFDLSTIAKPYVDQVNAYIKSFTSRYSSYYYADVVGTETYENYFDDPYFSDFILLKVHPTSAGHKYMAEKILEALPTKDQSQSQSTIQTILSAILQPLTIISRLLKNISSFLHR